MKMYLFAILAVLLSTIPYAEACHGIGCTDNTPPSHCRAFGCPNPPGPPRCAAFGCNERPPYNAPVMTVTTTGKVYDDGTNYEETLNKAADSAEAQAKLQCGTKNISRASEWTIWSTTNFTFAKAIFTCN